MILSINFLSDDFQNLWNIMAHMYIILLWFSFTLSSSSLAIVINNYAKSKTANKTKTKIEGIVRYLQSTLLFTRYYIPQLFLQWCCSDYCWLASVLWCCYYFLGSF